MAIFNRLILSGAMPGGERWATQFTYAPAEGGDLPSTATQLATWADVAAQYFEGPPVGISVLSVMLSSGGTIEAIRTEHRNPALVAVGQSAVSPAFAGTGAPTRPNYTAMCLTLTTPLAGASYRGRNYWPALAAPAITVDGLFDGADTLNAIEEFAGLAVELSPSAANPPALLAVYSPLLDTVTPVTAVSADNVPDTMRSRKDSQVGTRQAVTYPPA